jgi:hypothetical protein
VQTNPATAHAPRPRSHSRQDDLQMLQEDLQAMVERVERSNSSGHMGGDLRASAQRTERRVPRRDAPPNGGHRDNHASSKVASENGLLRAQLEGSVETCKVQRDALGGLVRFNAACPMRHSQCWAF